jgi:hypothetical protein
MSIKKEALKLMVLAISAVLVAGCGPNPAATPGISTGTATLVPTKTEMPPTATYTPVPTDTATDTATPSPTPESFPIDSEKLSNNMPKSYADLLASVQANDGKYVEAPDPLANPQAGAVFLDWVKNKLIPALGGDETKLPRVDEFIGDYYIQYELVIGGSDAQAKPLGNQPEFFYFQHEGVVYPVLIMPLSEPFDGKVYDVGAYMLVLGNFNISGMDLGWGSLEKLAEGKAVMSIVEYPRIDCPVIPDIGKQMVAARLDAADYTDAKGGRWKMPAIGLMQMKGEH